MSILIATPCYGEQVTRGYLQSCLRLQESLITAGVAFDFLHIGNDSLITRARDNLAARFLATTFRKLLFIDADIEFDAAAVADLWNLDAELAACPYRHKRADRVEYAAWRDGALLTGETLAAGPVDYAGTGFMMIDREVFAVMIERKMVQPYEEKERRWAFFNDPVINEPGHAVKLSEDYFFCRQARLAGYLINLHLPAVPLKHWGACAF